MPDDKTDATGAAPIPRGRHARVVHELESFLDRRLDDPDGWLGRLRERLPRLADRMRKLFEEKELGQLYTDLPGRRPRVATRLEDLKEEHPRMLTEMDSIAHAASGLQDAGLDELIELNSRIEYLVTRLRRHDAVENEILYEVYWDDVGAGD